MRLVRRSGRPATDEQLIDRATSQGLRYCAAHGGTNDVCRCGLDGEPFFNGCSAERAEKQREADAALCAIARMLDLDAIPDQISAPGAWAVFFAPTHYVDGIQTYGNGTVQLTIKRRARA